MRQIANGAENVDLLGDLMNSGRSATDIISVEISRNTLIRHLSVGRISHDHFISDPPTNFLRKQHAYSIANVFSGSVVREGDVENCAYIYELRVSRIWWC